MYSISLGYDIAQSQSPGVSYPASQMTFLDPI